MRHFFTLILSFSFFTCITAQCPPGDTLYLMYQNDIDSFAINYPNCTELPGTLFLGWFNPDITDLSGLNQITSIGGDLGFAFHYSTFSGLENLGSIGRNFHIFFGDFENFEGFNNLNYIGGSFIVEASYFTDFTGLENLTTIENSLILRSFDDGLIEIPGGLPSSLSSLNGLDNLDFSTLDNLAISNCQGLSVCSIEPVCSYLGNGGNAYIADNATGCNSIEEVLYCVL